MPTFDFSLPHWAYWIGLIVFPAAAMYLARHSRTDKATYQNPLAYLILITGGLLGLHRFYVKSMWGLVFLPIFVSILIFNAQERDARSALSDANNLVRVAERTLDREVPRVATAKEDLPRLQANVDEAEPGSVALRSAERRLKRAQDAVDEGLEKIDAATIELETARPAAEAAAGDRAFWSNMAQYAFYAILALMAVDAFLLPGLVRKANKQLAEETEDTLSMLASEDVAAAAEMEARKPDPEYAENWIDRMSLYAGEFVSYWAVIAVFVYYFEVISRYVFNSPSNWAHESMYLMFGMQYLISGSYAMMTDSHVKVDIFYAPLSRPRKAWVDLATSILFFIFAGTLLVTSYIFAMDAIAVPQGNSVVSDWARGDIGFFSMLGNLTFGDWTDPAIRWGEISFNEWEVPLWPMKWVMVVGGLLLIMQGISKLGKDIRAIRQGA